MSEAAHGCELSALQTLRQEGSWATPRWWGALPMVVQSERPGPLACQPCRHPSIRTLSARFSSLGASWVFSLQPVLPPDFRPPFPSRDGSWARPLTQSPELGAGARCFHSMNLKTMRLPAIAPLGCGAVVRRPLRSPTSDAARPKAFVRSRSPLVSSRSFRHAPPALDPSAADRCSKRPQYVVRTLHQQRS